MVLYKNVFGGTPSARHEIRVIQGAQGFRYVIELKLIPGSTECGEWCYTLSAEKQVAVMWGKYLSVPKVMYWKKKWSATSVGACASSSDGSTPLPCEYVARKLSEVVQTDMHLLSLPDGFVEQMLSALVRDFNIQAKRWGKPCFILRMGDVPGM